MRNKFIRCGVMGWCLEVIYTGLGSLCNKDMRLMSKTSILMFPIYGLAALLSPISKLLHRFNFIFRGTIYAIFIFLTEYATGSFLKKLNICPWDYSKAKLNIKGVIRLDFAPLWFGAGLLFEKFLGKS